jgi:hypothetical protein
MPGEEKEQEGEEEDLRILYAFSPAPLRSGPVAHTGARSCRGCAGPSSTADLTVECLSSSLLPAGLLGAWDWEVVRPGQATLVGLGPDWCPVGQPNRLF